MTVDYKLITTLISFQDWMEVSIVHIKHHHPCTRVLACISSSCNVYNYVCTYVCLHVWMYVHMYACLCTCVCACYTFMYLRTHTQIYIQTDIQNIKDGTYAHNIGKLYIVCIKSNHQIYNVNIYFCQ